MQQQQRRAAARGSTSWGNITTVLSLAVNAYVVVYLTFMSRQPAPLGGRGTATELQSLPKASDALSRRALVDSRGQQGVTVRQQEPVQATNAVNAGPHDLHDDVPEVWALGARSIVSPAVVAQVRTTLADNETTQLRDLCGRCLFQTLTKSLEVWDIGSRVFVATGDIPDQWIRDSSVQLSVYLPRLAAHPVLRPILEGAIRTQAYYILSDPWANSYRRSWAKAESMSKFDRQIGRGGWIATRNFEVDSGAYFLSLLWNYATTAGLWNVAGFLNTTLIHDAVMLMVDTWITEQHHEERSPYRYAELPREGRGALSNYTGMIWSGFRPSDDPNKYGFNIPVNMYAAGSLGRIAKLNARMWNDPALQTKAEKLAADIKEGIDKFGIVRDEGQPPYYAYEVDGLGNRLASFDDPNVPSLLSMPLLGYQQYDKALYDNTRKRILSPANSHYFVGKELQGCGSPHTPRNYVWSLAHCVQGLTSGENASEVVTVLRQLLKMQGMNGLMHESNEVNNPQQLTRPLFQWANTMFVVLYEQLFGDCSQGAEALRIKAVEAREAKDKKIPQNQGPDIAAYYERLEQSIVHA